MYSIANAESYLLSIRSSNVEVSEPEAYKTNFAVTCIYSKAQSACERLIRSLSGSQPLFPVGDLAGLTS